mmetsp:Transcript_45/g.127  ORF Transcript_45/g.127 Transcript_45/m.127 type:complete len:156 (-) Transcript_45:45-512(-)
MLPILSLSVGITTFCKRSPPLSVPRVPLSYSASVVIMYKTRNFPSVSLLVALCRTWPMGNEFGSGASSCLNFSTVDALMDDRVFFTSTTNLARSRSAVINRNEPNPKQTFLHLPEDNRVLYLLLFLILSRSLIIDHMYIWCDRDIFGSVEVGDDI